MNFEETTERRLNDHSDRIRALEIKDASQNEKIDTLCRELKELSENIRALMGFMQETLKEILWKALGGMGGLLFIFLGFFIWYVQCLR